MNEEEEEFLQIEEKFIERVHENTTPILESEVKSIKSLNKYYFEQMFSDYLYEINFPKDCQLEVIEPYSFSFRKKSSNFYSIKLPPSLKEINKNSFQQCIFLNEITFLKDENGNNNLEIIDDNAFSSTLIQSISIPENVKKLGSYCFPSTLNNIIFEKGSPNLEKIDEKTFYKLPIEKLFMPFNIKPIVNPYYAFFKCNQLKSIIFDSYLDENQEIEIDSELEEDIQKRIEEKKMTPEEIISKIDDYSFPIIEEERLYFYSFYREAQDFPQSYLLSQTKIENLDVCVSNLNYFYFYNTPNLKNISISKSDKCKYVKQEGCLYTKDMKKLIVAERNIKEVIIDSNCITISNYAFNFEGLEKVEFDQNSQLQEISQYAFSDSSIQQISLPKTVDIIERGAFFNCSKLQKVNIPPLIDIINFDCFSLTKLTEITIHKNVLVIYENSFYKCKNLCKVVFEEGSKLLEIRDSAFSYTNIETISIPKSVNQIKKFCFQGCMRLKSINIDPDSELYFIGKGCFEGTLIDEFKLLETIKDFDLSYTNAKKISIPSSLIIKSADFQSTLIAEISLPPSVEIIHSFYNCPNLTTVKIVDIENSKLKKIEEKAFFNCFSLTEFKMPKSVKYFGLYCFANCNNYKAEIIVSNDSHITVKRNAFENSGILSFESKSQDILIEESSFKNCPKIVKFVSDVSQNCIIENDVFLNCVSLTNFIISNEVENIEIGENCFQNSSINEFEIPSNLTLIPKSCFKSCKNLTNIKIDENSNIRHFDVESFYDSGIQSIFIPPSCKLIGESCFENCKELKNIEFSINIKFCELSISAFASSGLENFCLSTDKSISKIHPYCFEKCKNLTSVSLPNYKYFEKIFNGTFEFSGIKNIVFPSSINSIDKFAFRNCKVLQSVKFNADLVYIFNLAFSGCSNLRKIEFNILNAYLTENTYIYLKNGEISNEIISALTVTDSIIHDFNYFNKKYCYLVDDKVNLNYCQLNFTHYDDSANISYDKPGYFVQSKGSCYYIKNKTKLVCCDFQAESINISKETQIIKSSAFKFTNLKKVNFAKGSKLIKIKTSAFENLLIEEISIPNSVIFIGAAAFRNCKSLKIVKIKKSSKLETIGECAFENTTIETILFPSTLTEIGDYAFYKCSNLKTIDNYSNKIHFGIESFYQTPIEKIKFPSESYFDVRSFYGCSKLKQLNFHGNITKIIFGEESFAFSGLEELKIKYSSEIHEYAFAFCKSLKKVHISGNDIIYDYYNSFYYSNINTCLIEMKKRCINDNISNLIDSLLDTSIERCSITLINEDKSDDLFLNHKCYVVNNSLLYADLIDNTALYEELSQEQLNNEFFKKNEILRIPSKAVVLNFPIMSHIKKITWGPNCSVEEFGSNSFFSYCNLVEVTIPKLIKIIPPHSFDHCHYLKVLEFDNESKLELIGDYACANTRIQKVNLPKTVMSIGKGAFSNIAELEEVHFEGQKIGQEAFSSSGIKKFDLSDNVLHIAKSAFQYCRSLTQFNIDIEKSNLNRIDQYAFYETSIEKINIPPLLKKELFVAAND